MKIYKKLPTACEGTQCVHHFHRYTPAADSPGGILSDSWPYFGCPVFISTVGGIRVVRRGLSRRTRTIALIWWKMALIGDRWTVEMKTKYVMGWKGTHRPSVGWQGPVNGVHSTCQVRGKISRRLHAPTMK